MTEKQSKSDMQERRKETGQEYCKSEHGKGGRQDRIETGQDACRIMQDRMYAEKIVCRTGCRT